MSTFAEQISAALDTNDARAAGERVHRVVADEISSLDPTASTEITGYFNHSYVPDLMISWGSGKSTVERPVFLGSAALIGDICTKSSTAVEDSTRRGICRRAERSRELVLALIAPVRHRALGA